MKRVCVVGLRLLVLAVLLTVFAAYLRPELAFTLASQLWSCF